MYLHPLSGLAMATALGLAQLSAHAAPVQIKAPAELPAKPGIADAVKASKPSDWRPLDPDNTLYLELPSGRVVMELAPEFAPQHVANIKALVAEQYYDGLAIIRAQDNWVV